MDRAEWLANRFEEHRTHLKAVAYRMVGSLSEADDAVQEAWLRLSRSDDEAIENLRAWLTTVVARVCLNMLRSRSVRREEPLDVRVPDPIVGREDASDPEYRAILADAVGLALHVVIDTLEPDERLAFVLHDMFAVPFDEIAPIVGRSSDATRQLASRARRRVQGAPVPDGDIAQQRAVIDAFQAAASSGDLESLVALLDPNIVLRADRGVLRAGSTVLRGVRAVAQGASGFARGAAIARPALVNGAAGLVATSRTGRMLAVAGFTVVGGRIVEMDILADPKRLEQLDLTFLDD
jgi:RNA polymerase sigma factor (sigma-70 family)